MNILGVVVPIWNKEQYLEECINSLLKQTYGAIIIVLVDDGSTDSSLRICEEYAKRDDRIIVVHQKNKGPISARIRGIRELNTKYVTFVDADDWISEDTYQDLLPFMNQDFDVIEYCMNRYFSGEIRQDKKDIPYQEYNRKQLESIILPRMIWDNSSNGGVIDPSLCNKIIKRECLIGAYEKCKGLNIHYGEDVVVTYPIIHKCNSYVLSEKGNYYHRRQTDTNKAVYMQNTRFIPDLTILYEYLKKELYTNDNYFDEQIDHFFLYSVRFYMRKYRGGAVCVDYMFPFHLIPRNSRIVLYGAGTVGQFYHEEVRRIPYCEVVLWVDKRQSEGVAPISEIKNVEYDYVVIAVKKECMAKEIECELVELGVKKRNIIWSE